MNWKQRNADVATVKDAVLALSDADEEGLLNPQETSSLEIQNLSAAADLIRRAIASETPISVMGDYDVDGVTAASILFCILTKMGGTPTIRLPRRMSEGYGLNIRTIDEFQPGLLVTVDNGIAAVEAIAEAKRRGFTVIILDHHLPQEVLPNADIIVDPHVEPEKNGFVDYCGAGLAYKLAQILFAEDTFFLKKMEALAAIGTIADSMPLIGDNRVIVKGGLKSLKSYNSFSGKNNLLPGVRALLQVADVYDVDETDIGFKIGPMLNAAGRMRDDGAALSYKTLTAMTMQEGVQFATQLKELNDERKQKTAEYEEIVNNTIEMECLAYNRPMCVFAEGIPEGIVGILTGRIAERYKTPAFLFTTSEAAPDVFKGSGRSYGDYNLMDVVNAAMPFLEKGGGHAGAAGISVRSENYYNNSIAWSSDTQKFL